jgi:hypothetical protein
MHFFLRLYSNQCMIDMNKTLVTSTAWNYVALFWWLKTTTCCLIFCEMYRYNRIEPLLSTLPEGRMVPNNENSH